MTSLTRLANAAAVNVADRENVSKKSTQCSNVWLGEDASGIESSLDLA